MTPAEQKELIVQSYARTFDKEMAYKKVGLSPQEQIALDNDEDLQERFTFFLIEEREKIISKFRTFMDSEDEKISFQATVKLAEVLYPDFFSVKDKKSKDNSLDEPLTKEEARRLAEEYALVFKSGKNGSK